LIKAQWLWIPKQLLVSTKAKNTPAQEPELKKHAHTQEAKT
jgi:hypothetical protein